MTDYGSLLNGVNKHEEAIKIFRRAISLDPSYARAHNNLGNTFKTIQKNDEAIIELQEAIRLNPEYALAHHNLGEAYLNKKDFENAKKSFLVALRYSPDYEEVKQDLAKLHIDWGYQLLHEGHPAEGEIHFRKSMEWEELAGNHAGLCWALLKNNNIPEAMLEGSQAVKMDSKLAFGFACLGAAVFETGNSESAIQNWERAVDLHPNNGPFWMGLAIAWLASDNENEAAKAYCKASSLHCPFTDKEALRNESWINWSETSLNKAMQLTDFTCPIP